MHMNICVPHMLCLHEYIATPNPWWRKKECTNRFVHTWYMYMHTWICWHTDGWEVEDVYVYIYIYIYICIHIYSCVKHTYTNMFHMFELICCHTQLYDVYWFSHAYKYTWTHDIYINWHTNGGGEEDVVARTDAEQIIEVHDDRILHVGHARQYNIPVQSSPNFPNVSTLRYSFFVCVLIIQFCARWGWLHYSTFYEYMLLFTTILLALVFCPFVCLIVLVNNFYVCETCKKICLYFVHIFWNGMHRQTAWSFKDWSTHLGNAAPDRHVASLLPVHVGQRGLGARTVSVHDVAVFWFCGGLLKIKTNNIKSRDVLVWNCVKLWGEENG